MTQTTVVKSPDRQGMKKTLALLAIPLITLFAGCSVVQPDEGMTVASINVIDPENSQESLYHLSCGKEPSGSHPNPVESCEQLIAAFNEGVFEDGPAEQSCTDQFGGQKTARIHGNIKGERVDKSFSLSDGCSIAEWESLDKVLVVA